MALACLCAPARAGMERQLPRAMSFAAMYGRQPMSEVGRMTVSELSEFNENVLHFLRLERGAGE